MSVTFKSVSRYGKPGGFFYEDILNMTKNTVSAFASGADTGSPSYTLIGKYPERFYRRREVCEMLAIPSSTLTDYVKNGVIPKPLKLNPQESSKHGSAVWKESELLEFMNTRPRAE
jgi:predicted DNA-binding transcriptional regulator AlpA